MYLATCIALIVVGYLLNSYLNRREASKDEWHGPRPSKDEENRNQNWISDHLIKYPGSMNDLGKDFPQAVNRAKATIRYQELQHLLALHLISQQEYDAAIEEILPLIDISEDISQGA